jgi:hypothetical protein
MPFVNANVNGGCVPYARKREGRSRSQAVDELGASGHGELSHSRACARAGLHALGHTRGWDETMRQSRSVRIVYVYVSRRVSARSGPEAP